MKIFAWKSQFQKQGRHTSTNQMPSKPVTSRRDCDVTTSIVDCGDVTRREYHLMSQENRSNALEKKAQKCRKTLTGWMKRCDKMRQKCGCLSRVCFELEIMRLRRLSKSETTKRERRQELYATSTEMHGMAWWSCWRRESIENARPHQRQSLVKLHKSPRQASSYASEYRWDWKRGWPDGTIAWRHAFHWITWCKQSTGMMSQCIHTALTCSNFSGSSRKLETVCWACGNEPDMRVNNFTFPRNKKTQDEKNCKMTPALTTNIRLKLLI